MILAWKALYSSSFLWRTRRWDLMADMILKKEPTRIFAKNNPQKKYSC
jgi:hypothetical protein